ncbi:hypothetical protein EX530_20195 [Xanthomonas phaseoli]|uniref:hypothetical protein n=1 Tax=Xanthomonas phaseoli TaxID=1985254 RepID=UPI003B003A46
MSGRILGALLLFAISVSSYAQDISPPAWGISASMPDQELIGEWELSQLSKGASPSEVLRSTRISEVAVESGASFQLHVKLIDPQGVVTDITSSPKLIYRPKGCLTVTADGFATVSQATQPPSSCSKGAPVPLSIIYADRSTGVAAINMYLFRID